MLGNTKKIKFVDDGATIMSAVPYSYSLATDGYGDVKYDTHYTKGTGANDGKLLWDDGSGNLSQQAISVEQHTFKVNSAISDYLQSVDYVEGEIKFEVSAGSYEFSELPGVAYSGVTLQYVGDSETLFPSAPTAGSDCSESISLAYAEYLNLLSTIENATEGTPCDQIKETAQALLKKMTEHPEYFQVGDVTVGDEWFNTMRTFKNEAGELYIGSITRTPVSKVESAGTDVPWTFVTGNIPGTISSAEDLTIGTSEFGVKMSQDTIDKINAAAASGESYDGDVDFYDPSGTGSNFASHYHKGVVMTYCGPCYNMEGPTDTVDTAKDYGREVAQELSDADLTVSAGDNYRVG